MRLDKFLKVSRIIKRRTLAKDAVEAERVFVNDKPAKPSKDVKLGDHITIYFGKKIVEIEVLNITNSTKIKDAELMYKLIREEEKVG